MRSFGVGVGQISSPTLSGGWSSGSIPTDDRRSEVFCAAVVSSLSLLWLSMQVGSISIYLSTFAVVYIYLSIYAVVWSGLHCL